MEESTFDRTKGSRRPSPTERLLYRRTVSCLEHAAITFSNLYRLALIEFSDVHMQINNKSRVFRHGLPTILRLATTCSGYYRFTEWLREQWWNAFVMHTSAVFWRLNSMIRQSEECLRSKDQLSVVVSEERSLLSCESAYRLFLERHNIT